MSAYSSRPTAGPSRSASRPWKPGILSEALSRCGGNKTRAAAELGLSRVGLRNKLARYGLDLDAPDTE